MNSNLHIDQIEFKAWYQHPMKFIDNLILVAWKMSIQARKKFPSLSGRYRVGTIRNIKNTNLYSLATILTTLAVTSFFTYLLIKNGVR